MYSNHKLRTEIFVYFPITPIKLSFEDSLYEYLLSNVWGDRREADEDIRVGDYRFGNPTAIDVVRYQFGETYDADEFTDEIGELIKRYTEQWIFMNGGLEVVGA